MGPREQFDAFLPSGAVEDARPSTFNPRASNATSPQSLFPEYIPQPSHGGSHASPPVPKPYPSAQSLSYFSPPLRAQSPNAGSLSPSQSQNGPPISPPVSRSASSEGTSSIQVDYWRSHVQRIREQARGERAHMVADRARADEVMEEERALWEEERKLLKARISELEVQLYAFTGQLSAQSSVIFQSTGGTPQGITPQGVPQRPPPQAISGPVNGSINGTAARAVPQESGRLLDGSALWAPATQNPSRTFETTESNNLRVDSMSAPREALRVTSKELKASDFAVNSPSPEEQSREGSITCEGSIDISAIQPDLEGIALKASAVAPEFKANIMSPSNSISPSKGSSTVVSPPLSRDITNNQNGGLQRSGSPSKKGNTLEVITAPENDRRKMHAGHTPNHSISKFDLGESGSITPTQNQQHRHDSIMAQNRAEQHDGNTGDDEEHELKGPLGLRNEPEHDSRFLNTLDKKLLDAVNELATLPSEASVMSVDPTDTACVAPRGTVPCLERRDSLMSAADDDEPSEKAIDEAPRLKVKQSINFGRPFGSL